MRNVWKGLVVGGLTGVAAGAILDSVARASQKAVELGGQVRGRAPEAGRLVQSLSDKASEWVHDANVSETVRDTVERVKDSDPAGRAAHGGRGAVAAAKEAAAPS
jgi:hypothetical protein